MTKNWQTIIEIILVLTALAGSIYVAFTPANSLMNWYNIDDAFYYYKVAQNFLSGHGFSFDGINLSNGFHPLWMIVCLSIFWLTKYSLILPLRVLVVVSGLFNAATALFLFRLMIKRIHPAAAILAAFFWALSPGIYSVVTVHGMESSVSAFCLALLAWKSADLLTAEDKITPRQMIGLGVIGALTILARLDNVFLVGIVGFFILFKVRKASRDLVYDLIAISLAVIASWVLRLGLEDVRLNSYSIYPMLGVAILVKPIVFYFCGMYTDFGNFKPVQKLLHQVIAAVVNFGLMFALLTIMHKLGFLNLLSKSVIAYDAAISTAFIFCLRLRKWEKSPLQASPFGRFKTWFAANWKCILVNGTFYAMPIAVLVGIYVTFNRIVFGSFSPVSGQIKIWWNTLPNTVYAHQTSILSLLGLNTSSSGPWRMVTSRVSDVADFLMYVVGKDSPDLWSIVYLLLFFIVLLLFIALMNSSGRRAGRRLFDLMIPAFFLGCLFQIAYYYSVGYQAMRSWYWVSQMMTTVLTVAAVLDIFFTWLDRFPKKPVWSIAVAALLIMVIFARHSKFIVSTYPQTVLPGKELAYLGETRAVESYTDPGSKIGMTGGGIVGYFIEDRTVVNLDGLINSVEYFNAMKNGKAQAFLDNLPLNYVYGKAYVLKSSDPYRSILSGRLIEIGMIRGYDNFTLYRYEANQ